MNFVESKLQLVVMIAFCAITAISEAIFGLCLGDILDVINESSMNHLITLLIFLCMLIVVSISTSILARVCMFKNASRSVAELKNHILKKQMGRTRGEQPDVAEFTSKTDLLFTNYFMNKQLVFLHFATFICACIAIIYINWIMFIVAFITSVIPFIVPVLYKRISQSAASEYSDESTHYTEFVSDTLYGRLEIMKYNVAAKYMTRHEDKNAYFETKRVKTLSVNFIGDKISEGIGNLMYVFVLFAGGVLVNYDYITIGNVLSVVQLMNATVVPVRLIVSCVNQINSCKPIYDELWSVGEKSSTKQFNAQAENVTRSGHVLVAEHLMYSFPDSGRTVIDDFSFSFISGKKYLIKGESGSGKTTLARILSGELTPDSGKVCIGNREITDFNLATRIKIVNYVDQNAYLFRDSLWNNITLYRDGYDSADGKNRVTHQLVDFRLNHIDIDAALDNSSGVSGGEKSRICLLRAMLDMPWFLIADEPTASLDRANTSNVIHRLCSCSSAVIVIAHNLDEELEKLFDEIICMRR